MKPNFLILIFAGLLLTLSFSTIKAQDEVPSNDAAQNNQTRPSLLSELNLSQEQVQQIRRINRENQPLLREAQQRLRDARNNLDQAIYADDSNETDVKARLKDVHAAQAEVVRLRSTTEFAVRKVLTPEQLVKFREVRQRFMQRGENAPNQRNNRPLNEPNQKIVNRPRRLRKNN